MSNYVILSKEVDYEVTVYDVKIGSSEVDFDLSKDNDDDLRITVAIDDAIAAIKLEFNEDEIREAFGL